MKISTNLRTTIYDIVHAKKAKSYWESSKKLPRAIIDSVDWDAIDIAMKEVPRHRQTLITKHIVGMCGVGKFLKRWKERATSECSIAVEDALYVWICPHPEASALWDTSIQRLKDWMDDQATDPDVQEAICQYLMSCRQGANSSLVGEVFWKDGRRWNGPWYSSDTISS
jgi:hypothetical protein